MPPRVNAANNYAKLEQRMSLLAWLQSRLGYDSASHLLADIKEADEGFDSDGRSYVYARLASRAGQMRELAVADLERYDDNIREYLTAMNARRPQPITLRYFQYLAALCAEIFLDRYFNAPGTLLGSLNQFVGSLNSNRAVSERVDLFERSDLKKLAFWMATGSGKTLLMHINYLQFLHYNREPLDNILLITPNEGLTQQHLDEMEASGIPAVRLDLNENSLFSSAPGVVKVTEITKLVMEKKGEGESIPVEALEGNNLIFVDEGHKGSGGEAWREVRDALGESSFTFEYSATFGQALTAARNDALTTEYGKAIAFDYSYRHFYNDGYGKDFHIVNLLQETTSDHTDELLLANMLSFYEQRLVFGGQSDALRPYNLDKPLWVFIGRSVNAVHTERGQPQSDVLTVVRFLHRFLTDRSWATRNVGQLLEGQSGLRDKYGYDVFSDKFDRLRQLGTDPTAVYQDILETVLHTPTPGALHLCDISGSDGELGLKVGGSDGYFGLIYIGDTSRFKTLTQRSDTGIAIESDAFSGSLFDRINESDTSVEILIGSRKFMEGWNSWRVSNMGLLNIGRSEGSQIIQLFGRGVRLRGRDMSLKRSSALNGNHPDYIRLLETLNIFAVRANYMAQFRDYLEREGVSTESLIDLPLFIRPNREFLDKGLVVPRAKDDLNFNAGSWVLLEPDKDVRVSVNVSARAQTIGSGADGEGYAGSGEKIPIPPESLDLVNWSEIYRALLEHKERKGMDNLIINFDDLRRVMEFQPRVYSLVAEESVVRPENFDDLERLQEAVLSVLRKYAEAVYRRRRAQWESNNLIYKTLDENDPNFGFNIAESGGLGRYIVSVPRSETQLRQNIEQLIADCNALHYEEEGALPRIHFDRHLYQPLLVDNDGKFKMSPPGLNPGERKFVEDLRRYWTEEQDNMPEDVEVFLLRNQGRGAGIGFFENSGFYPDFILWIKSDDCQRIVFIEPHGMRNQIAYAEDEKVRLYERLPDLAREISQRSGKSNVLLDSFIVSQTPYLDLKKIYGNGDWRLDDFTRRHILFPARNDQYDYVKLILSS